MISVIIPAYYANDQLVYTTIRCIYSLQTTFYGQIILVDDGSPIKPTIYDVSHIVLPENKGYAGAVNAGLRAAKGDIIVVGNNDLIFEPLWLTRLLQPLEAGFDVATCWTSDQKYIKSAEIEPDAKFGSLFAMKRKVYDTIGGFDEQFRGYFSDDDYRKRVLEAGFTIGKNCNLVVEHLAKATYSQTDPGDLEFQRSKILYEIKYGLE